MSKKGILLVAVLIFALAAMAQFTFNLLGVGGEEMRMVNTGHGVSYAFDANPSFYSNNSRFFYFATRTGMRHVASGGGTGWQETFALTRPLMVTRGDVAAVGEAERGRAVYVYNSNGYMYSVTFDHPLVGFSVNAAGYLAAITQVDGGFHIHVYNRLRQNDYLFRWSMYHEQFPMRYPVAAEVSEDGLYIVIAYWNTSGRQLATEIQFWTISEDGPRFGTDGLFAGLDLDDALLRMRFMANNQLLLITDTQITLHSVAGNAVSEVWEEPLQLHNRLSRLAFCGNNRFAFVSGAPIRPDGRYADPLGTVNIFDLNGQTGRFYLGRNATHLSMGHNSVIVGADRYFHAISARGTSLWHHTVTHDVRDMIFLDNTDTVLIAGANRAYVWRRQRVRD